MFFCVNVTNEHNITRLFNYTLNWSCPKKPNSGGISRGSRRERLLSKIVENECEKIDRLMELYMRFVFGIFTLIKQSLKWRFDVVYICFFISIDVLNSYAYYASDIRIELKRKLTELTSTILMI